jgi:hypothetical protein
LTNPKKIAASPFEKNIFFRLEAISLLPFNPGGHAAYQDYLVSVLPEYYPDLDSIPSSTWNIINKFYYKDLSTIDETLCKFYSVFGPAPRLPSCMLRSTLVALNFGVASYTEWAKQLKLNPLYAILSGFKFGDTPGVGTFYDFINRLWLSETKNLSPHVRLPKSSVRKPSKKGSKSASVDKITVEDLLKRFLIEPPNTDQPFSCLFDIFKKEFLGESVKRGLITPSNLSIAGDGTPIVTSARERKKRLCKCKHEGITNCGCTRYYSQPDCDIGWDSSRDRFYHGYDLYMLTAANSDNDLPIFPLLSPASRHDSHGFLYAWFTMKAYLPGYQTTKLLLDSAHDAMAIYKYCKTERITPFIDLNEKRGIKIKYKNDFIIGSDGIPICMAGHKMHRDGVEKSKHRLKFRCPLMSRKHGSACVNPCSDSKFGRTVHVAMKDNPRIFNIPVRGSNEWKLEYNARTAAERCNKRMKIDYKLEDGKHRSSRMWYCRLFCVMMCQHLDAWGLPDESKLKNRLLQAA